MKEFRNRIYDLVQVGDNTTKTGRFYDWAMMIVIITSLAPLVFKEVTAWMRWVDLITAIIFIIDYIMRLFVADMLLNKKGAKAFFIYPLTPMAIIDLISILPSLFTLNSGFKLLRLFRLLRTLRVFRVFKLFRYSKSIKIIKNVIRSQKNPLLCVCGLALAYVTVVALVIFNIEPQTFDNFFEAFYWSIVSLTTMGYGDIYPVTTEGRIITMMSAFVGIAIVALPAGIVTAGYMAELENQKEDEE